MNLEDLKLGDIMKLKSLISQETMQNISASNPFPYKIGKSVLIRTVTHYYIGKIKYVYPQELVLEECSWIPDTGRYYDALKKGTLSEVEPIIGDAVIGRGAIIDCVSWLNDIPKDQK